MCICTHTCGGEEVRVCMCVESRGQPLVAFLKCCPPCALF